ncbi:MAG: hypothetical protein U9O64_01045 [Campylobacterota bacterium]|nr:hypothetical protein [Campylobacterota bacterium]
MKQFLLITLLGLVFTFQASAKPEYHHNETEVMSEKQIKKMDRKYHRKQAKERDFRTRKEFEHKRKKPHSKQHQSYDRYNNGHYYNRPHYRETYRMNRQEGYRHSKKGWRLAYRYDRASFYDNQGFFYGYFNQYGYYFEDVFYQYDRYYRYRDRVKGRGLFDHRYYMPANAAYYGFCR